jgi:4-amino-4-deoxy-L-arabinose transferase-like glycosyltransferase
MILILAPPPLDALLILLLFYVVIFRQRKKVDKLMVLGVIVFLAIVLPWPLAVAYKMDWNLATWKHEFIDRFFGTYASGNKPLYYYLPKMFQFTMPWAAFVPFALAAPFYRVWNKKQPVMQFLWLWFVVVLAFLTISSGKRQHYIIPAIPAMAILAGILLEDMAFSKKAYTSRFARNFLLSHLVILIIGFVALPIVIGQLLPEVLRAAILLSAAGLIGLLVVAGLFRAKRAPVACGALFVSIAVLVMIGYSGFINPLNYNQPSRQFTQAVVQKVPASDKLIAYESASARFIHYFGRRVPKIGTKSEVYELYKKGWWVVAFGTYLGELRDNGGFEIAYERENAERHGQNIVGGALLHKSGGNAGDDTILQ